jgi:glycosyltransferase involved in cell wall biosynthesis
MTNQTLPAPPDGTPEISIVIPAYNEAEVLPEFHARLDAVLAGLGVRHEVVYVNDGSTDSSLDQMLRLRAADPRVSVVNLSRNFGKEIALTAGLDHARATGALIVIDADLQDPPELIPELVARWRAGFDVVYATRASRAGEGWLKRATAKMFYKVIRRASGRVVIPADTGDFRLMSRRAVDALLRLREQHRFMKGLFAWIGFPSTAVLYDRAHRHAGLTKWNFWRLWNLSIEGITSFTTAPLMLATYLGFASAVLAAVMMVKVVLITLLEGDPVPGYPSLMAVVLFLGGVQLMTLGIIGEYIGRIFNETKGRPLYLVERHLAGAPSPLSAADLSGQHLQAHQGQP